jgi:muramoyltetrapeptide carboxypeptidase
MKQANMVPSALSKGDKVEVLVLSSPDAYHNPDQFKKGVQYLKNIGLAAHYRDEALLEHGYLVAPAREQAKWIMEAYTNEETKGIFLANGGSNLNRVIQHLDFGLIRRNPKLIIGMSNMSILLNAITTMCGIVTYYGPAVIFNMGNDSGFDKYSEKSFLNTVFHTEDKTLFEKFSEWKNLHPGKTTGMVAGGNLTTIESLLGTPFEPKWDETILFWEDCFMELHSLDMVLSHFELAGVFKKVKGIVIGRPLEIAETEFVINTTFDQFIQDFFAEYKIPMMYNVDFGHNDEKQVLPIGKTVEIDTEKLDIREV